MAQALPNGYCGLPAKQGSCPHANACLTCTHFRTDKSFLSHHERQLKETTEIINSAEKKGWQRQAEMNQVVKINLETIIATLKGKRREPA
jgi:integrase/recombinase XerD